jgi:hypothetical protein
LLVSHPGAGGGLAGAIDLVDAVLADPEASALTDAEKALFRFVRKVNFDSVNIGPADMEVLHQVGYTDEAIYYALTVCALFNFYNRWIDASGVHPMSDEAHRAGAKRSAQHGYSRSSQPPPTAPPK